MLRPLPLLFQFFFPFFPLFFETGLSFLLLFAGYLRSLSFFSFLCLLLFDPLLVSCIFFFLELSQPLRFFSFLPFDSLLSLFFFGLLNQPLPPFFLLFLLSFYFNLLEPFSFFPCFSFSLLLCIPLRELSFLLFPQLLCLSFFLEAIFHLFFLESVAFVIVDLFFLFHLSFLNGEESTELCIC